MDGKGSIVISSSNSCNNLDFVKWATIKRLVECRCIAPVVRVVVKAVVLVAVVAAVVTVAEVKDKTVVQRAGESGMIAITCVLKV